ncbi:MAG: hypothetical protein V3R29_09930 [Candidatus Acidoferrales bacterium]
MRKVKKRLLVMGFLPLVLLVGALVASADDCGSPGDCQTAPGNINGATGVAAGVAVLVLVYTVLNGSGETTPSGEQTDEELLEGAEEEEETRTEDVSVSAEDILGGSEPSGTEPGGTDPTNDPNAGN